MSLYFRLHLNFLIEFLEVSLYNLYTVHESTATMSVLVSTTYVLYSVFEG